MSLQRTRHLAKLLGAQKYYATDMTKIFLRPLSVATAAVPEPSLKWDLASSVCLERKPVVTANLTEMEEKMQNFLNKLELEGSIKSDHELRREKDLATLAALQKGSASEADLEQATKATAQEFEDSSVDEISKFTFASRTNEKLDADLKAVDRHMSSHLILLVKQKLGSTEHWLMPQSTRIEGETMRQTAERALSEVGGQNMDTLVLGNAPVGFYKYKYPKDVREKKGVEGVKIFFFKALYRGGEVKSQNHMWATKQEMEKNVKREYFDRVDDFLFF